MDAYHSSYNISININITNIGNAGNTIEFSCSIDCLNSIAGDINNDQIVNILDVVQVINLILGPRFDDASLLEIFDVENEITLESDGYVGAIKMVLNHENHISIDLTKNVATLSTAVATLSSKAVVSIT